MYIGKFHRTVLTLVFKKYYFMFPIHIQFITNNSNAVFFFLIFFVRFSYYVLILKKKITKIQNFTKIMNTFFEY